MAIGPSLVMTLLNTVMMLAGGGRSCSRTLQRSIGCTTKVDPQAARPEHTNGLRECERLGWLVPKPLALAEPAIQMQQNSSCIYRGVRRGVDVPQAVHVPEERMREGRTHRAARAVLFSVSVILHCWRERRGVSGTRVTVGAPRRFRLPGGGCQP